MRTIGIKGSHSGHSLVGAILDCHPNIVIGNIYGRPQTVKEILARRNEPKKWSKSKYNLNHPLQNSIKSDLLWVGNTGEIENPDKIIGVVRNPYVMVNTLIKKHKTEDSTVKFMDQLFDKMENKVIFYEDILEFPILMFTNLADELRVQVPDYWLDVITILVQKNIPQIKMNINLDILFNKYKWLNRYN